MASTVHARPVHSRAPVAVGGSETTTIGWTQQLGHLRHGRDEMAAQTAQTLEAEAAYARTLSTRRWMRIVTAIARHVNAYNTGARRSILNIVERPEEASVTVVAGGDGAPYLTATLDGTFICANARDSLGTTRATQFRLCSDRGDDATAAYLLHNWMEHL